jgi:hypothetical protein
MTWRTTLFSPSLISTSYLKNFSLQQNRLPPPLISKQLNPPQLFQPPQHSFCQHLCYDLNFIEDSPPQESKSTLFFFFNLNTILKCYFFFAYFCSMCILFRCLFVFILFFSNKLVWIYDLYMLWFVLDFIKLYLFVNYWNLCQITD